MARSFTGDNKTIEIAQIAIKQATTLHELRQAQAVLLPLLYKPAADSPSHRRLPWWGLPASSSLHHWAFRWCCWCACGGRAQTPEHANGASGCRTSATPKAIPWLKRSGKKLPEILSEIVQDWAAGKPVKLMLLNELSKRHPEEQTVVVMHGPGWHRSGMLKAPSHIGLLKLPPYAPQLNPIAHVWDELREKFCKRLGTAP